MKSISLRLFFVTCLCVASFSSFMYINLGVDPDSRVNHVEVEEVYAIEADSSETTILLPDLEMLENVIRRGKNHLRFISNF